jgi:hypothetical protein
LVDGAIAPNGATASAVSLRDATPRPPAGGVPGVETLDFSAAAVTAARMVGLALAIRRRKVGEPPG